MEVYQTEEEQIEQIKKFWKEYGRAIIFTVVLFSLAMFAFRWWQQHQVLIGNQASMVYENVLIAMERDATSDVEAHTNDLIQNYTKTPYADLAQFILAKQDIHNGKPKEALERFNWVLDNASNKSIRQIARNRAAKLLLSDKKYQEAMKMLEKVDDSAFNPMVNEIKGDIFLAKGERSQARQSYAQAYRDLPNRPVLKMKLDDLATSDNQVASNPPGDHV